MMILQYCYDIVVNFLSVVPIAEDYAKLKKVDF